jgi:hypothetical protein
VSLCVFRAPLQPGGIYTFSHLAEARTATIYPFAMGAPDVLETPQNITDTLSAVGFVDIEDKASIASSKKVAHFGWDKSGRHLR